MVRLRHHARVRSYIRPGGTLLAPSDHMILLGLTGTGRHYPIISCATEQWRLDLEVPLSAGCPSSAENEAAAF